MGKCQNCVGYVAKEKQGSRLPGEGSQRIRHSIPDQKGEQFPEDTGMKERP